MTRKPSRTPHPKDLLTVQEVADRIGVHKRTIEREIERKKLKVVRIGRSVRIRPEDLEAYLMRHRS